MILEVRHYCSQWNNRTVSHCVNLCEMIGDYTISIVLFLTLTGSRYFSTDFGYRGVKKYPHYISSTIGTTIQYIQLYNCIQLYRPYNYIQPYTTIYNYTIVYNSIWYMLYTVGKLCQFTYLLGIFWRKSSVNAIWRKWYVKRAEHSCVLVQSVDARKPRDL